MHRSVCAASLPIAALVAFAPGCGGSSEEPFLCPSVDYETDIPLYLSGLCLHNFTAMARVDGAWTLPADITITGLGGSNTIELSATGPVEGFSLHIPDVPVDRMLQQGYQSWSFSGTVEIPTEVPLDEDGAPLMKEARTGDPIYMMRGVGYHAAVFRAGTAGPALVIGALSANRAVTGIAATRTGELADITVLCGPQRETLAPGDDGMARSELVYVAAADTPEEALDLLSREMTRAQALPVPKKPPRGWFSWNEHFTDISADLIVQHADLLAGELADSGMTLVEIDDGWERAWGDWQPNDRFPDGMAAVAGAITDRGLVAGIWLAPFLVDVESDTGKTSDPSLFVQGADGTPLTHTLFGNPRTFYILDGTNPDSMAMVVDEMRALAEAGYTFFKLDFLYAGALAGGRSQEVTGVEALREGLALIREAIGTDAVINACGAPTLPVLGLADSLRVGPDTAFEGYDLGWAMVASAARNLAARAHLFPVIWPDADQVQLRAPYSPDEARTGALVAALAGPAYSLGDDLTVLDPERRAIALDPMLLDMAGASEPARAVGIMDVASQIAPINPVVEMLQYPDSLAVLPPPTFVIVGESGTQYRVSVDWLGAHTAVIE